MPQVSVCMSTYNGMPHLAEALESILAQTFADIELIIVNDGSTDSTADYLRSVADSRLKVVNQDNRGLGASLNRCIELANSEFIARMDADDICLKERIAEQVELMHDKPDLVISGTRFEFFTQGGVRTISPPMPIAHEKVVSVLHKGGHGLCHPTVMFRTDIAKTIGGYRINGPGQDWDFFYRMCEAGKAMNLDKVLHKMRVHCRNTSLRNIEKVAIGISFAQTARDCRRSGEREPSYEQFIGGWEDRSLIKRFETRLYCRSQLVYKKGVLAHLQGKKRQAFAYSALAGLLAPNRVMRRIVNTLRNQINHA